MEERAAVLLDADGSARVVGFGSAYFIDAHDADGPRCNGKPLTFGPFSVAKVPAGGAFNLKMWTGGEVFYRLSAHDGKLHSTQPGGAIY